MPCRRGSARRPSSPRGHMPLKKRRAAAIRKRRAIFLPAAWWQLNRSPVDGGGALPSLLGGTEVNLTPGSPISRTDSSFSPRVLAMCAVVAMCSRIADTVSPSVECLVGRCLSLVKTNDRVGRKRRATFLRRLRGGDRDRHRRRAPPHRPGWIQARAPGHKRTPGSESGWADRYAHC